MENAKPRTRKIVESDMADKIATEMKDVAQIALMRYMEKHDNMLEKYMDGESGDVIQVILMAFNGAIFETLMSCDDSNKLRQDSKALMFEIHNKQVEQLFKIREHNPL